MFPTCCQYILISICPFSFIFTLSSFAFACSFHAQIDTFNINNIIFISSNCLIPTYIYSIRCVVVELKPGIHPYHIYLCRHHLMPFPTILTYYHLVVQSAYDLSSHIFLDQIILHDCYKKEPHIVHQ